MRPYDGPHAKQFKICVENAAKQKKSWRNRRKWWEMIKNEKEMMKNEKEMFKKKSEPRKARWAEIQDMQKTLSFSFF